MISFISKVLKTLQSNNVNVSEVTFILPSKRAGNFLKHELSKLISTTIFAPEVLSIEEFVEVLSQLKPLTNTELIFKFYEVYTENTAKNNIESFDVFSKWAQIILQDFNEIDRYLIPQSKIFDYLSAIQETNHWSLEENKTQLIKNYLFFWKSLKHYYKALSTLLIADGTAYQGLMYREAANNIKTYIKANTNKQYVFIGFNALNTAESYIIEQLLNNNLAKIYWDIDEVFMTANTHNANLFIKQYQTKWEHYLRHNFNWISDNYRKQKQISVIGIPKVIGQAKYIGQLLRKLKKTNTTLHSTAVVLGDENLLIPVLNSIPEEIDTLNITMGFPLKSIPLSALFQLLFQLQLHYTKTLYYKDVIAIISHPFIRPLVTNNTTDYGASVVEHIHNNNILFLTLEQLTTLFKSNKRLITILFKDWGDNPTLAINSCLELLLLIKEKLENNKDTNKLSLEYLYRFNEVFTTLDNLNANYKYINTIKTLHSLYNEILNSETLDFKGDQFQGLQIMGMLESRVLDFETVIIASVNEGILPSGKSNNSFIPFDVKLENKLPTYKEKDAIYAYHFYRLLQRAKHVSIIYNTEPDGLNGNEKSRFITQLDIENIHPLEQIIVSAKTPKIKVYEESITKNEAVINRLQDIAQQGFSPSSLTNYIRNPIDFYNQKILGVRENNTIEEVVEANTLGSVIHNTLEDFYKPLEGAFLSEAELKTMHSQIHETVSLHFKTIYKQGNLSEGKNLIIFEIAKRYISNFLNSEKELLKNGNAIKIIEIEADLRVPLYIKELNYPVYITGKVDRVDELNGKRRIIDYKSGKVLQNKVELIDWAEITSDYDKYSKSFQVLMYAYMLHQTAPLNFPVEAGIISFKNLSAGILKFAKKDSAGRGAKKEYNITLETLDAFYNELKVLILEICDPKIPFKEKPL